MNPNKPCECPDPEHDCNGTAVVRVERETEPGVYTIYNLCGTCELPGDTFIEWLDRN